MTAEFVHEDALNSCGSLFTFRLLINALSVHLMTRIFAAVIASVNS
jgi:hypothetical protein